MAGEEPKDGPQPEPPSVNPDPMGAGSVRNLTIFLVLVCLLCFGMVYALWAAQSDSASDPLPKPDCPASAPAAFKRLAPDKAPVGSSQDVWLIGCGFTEKTEVKFNGAPHQALFLDANHIRVGLSPVDTASAGTILVSAAFEGKDLGSGSLQVAPAVVYWNPFGLGRAALNQEVQLLLLVLFIGVLGSSIYALKSMADYRGAGKLGAKWFMFYAIQPVEGAGIAFLFYLVIRGGFLAGTGADIKTANLFGICAIAGLAGTFSDIAFLKLREVFTALFRPRDDRDGKLAGGLSIATKSLPDGVAGEEYKTALASSGGVAPFKWKVEPDLPAGLTLDPVTGLISGKPAAAAEKRSYKFTVTDSASTPASDDLSLLLEIKPAGSTPAPSSPPPPADDADGCDVPIADATPDDALPPTEGGVA